MKKISARVLCLVLALALVLVLASCGGSSTTTTTDTETTETTDTSAVVTASDSDTFTWVLRTDMVSFDPTQAYDDTTNMVVNQITEGLLNFGHDNEIITNLASSWECVDEVTYVYEVRDDITFSDGNPMTMEDVIWSLERNMDPEVASLVGWMYDSVDSLEQTGDWELTVHLANADATWQYAFATTAGHVIEKAAYEADGSIVGTGAYMLDSATAGTQYILTRNENYTTSTDDIYFNKIIYNVISEDTTRVEAFTSGQADFGLNPPLDMMDQLNESDTVNVNMFSTFGIDWLAFNTARAPFNDVNVRRAIACAIDIDLMYESLLSDTCSPSTDLPFSEALYGSAGSVEDWTEYSETFAKYSYDIDQAKAYLADSAYPDGFECNLMIDETSLQNSEALYIQAALAEIGITVNIDKETGAECVNVYFGTGAWDDANDCRDFDMMLNTWYADYPDISGNLYSLYYSGCSGVGGANLSAYSNADVDSYLEAQLKSTDSDERAELMKKALEIIEDEIPMIIIDYPLQGAMQNATLNNIQPNASYVWNNYVREWSRG